MAERTVIPEIPLRGGRTTARVVRAGDTVRRPQDPQSPFVHRLLQGLAESGCAAAPRFLGIDERQREILSFIPGEVPSELGEFSGVQLDAAARSLRALHDSTESLTLRGSSEVICHGDASPCNALFVGGLPVASIDFDAAYPGRRSGDLGYAAWLWLDIGSEDGAAPPQSQRLARFFAAYGAEASIDPVQAVLDAQARLCARPGGHPAWAQRCRLWTEQHRLELGRAGPA